LGNVYKKSGKLKQALGSYKEAMEMGKKLCGDYSDINIIGLNNISSV
jgi:hypothetical protein